MNSKPTYQPPYTITPAIVHLVARISEAVGRLIVLTDQSRALRLRRINRIRTIRGSLAIEGNTLNEAQITAILEGKRVIAPPREIQEVQNAIAAYDRFAQWNPEGAADLLEAHRILMAGLIDASGEYRRGSVGVMGGGEVIHLAPPGGSCSGFDDRSLPLAGCLRRASPDHQFGISLRVRVHPSFCRRQWPDGSSLAVLDSDSLEATVCRCSGGKPGPRTPGRLLPGIAKEHGSNRFSVFYRIHAQDDS